MCAYVVHKEMYVCVCVRERERERERETERERERQREGGNKRSEKLVCS